jgi:predicted RNA binding protein YcfA (HicA-like mRNA interferase family)
MNSKQVCKLLKNDGWVIKKQVGSHAQFVHPTKPGKVTVAMHGKEEIPPKTLKSIFRQAGLGT